MTLTSSDAWAHALAAWDATLETRRWTPLPHQVVPPQPWFLWLMLGGRGAGKTDGCAHELDAHVNGPPCLPSLPGGHRPAIIAPTLGDALDACVNGPSGLKAHNPAIRSVQTTGGTYVRWPNGCEGKLFGAYSPEDVERLRAGGNRCFVWAEELAAWRQLVKCWQHMVFGLRLGANPRVIASTTPKTLALLKSLIADPRTVLTKATTDDNPHLAASVRAELFKAYGGTRIGLQELYAEILDDVEGALVSWALLEAARWEGNLVPEPDPHNPGAIRWRPDVAIPLRVVGVDPSGSSTGDECGIVVCGADYGAPPVGYVLDDRSVRGSPAEWATAAVDAYYAWGCEAMVAEVNFGAEMVEQVVRTIPATTTRPGGDAVRLLPVRAGRGQDKRARILPIVGLYEQNARGFRRLYHVGNFVELETQQTTWVPPGQAESSSWSPDRWDALAWALSHLLVLHPSTEMTLDTTTAGMVLPSIMGGR